MQRVIILVSIFFASTAIGQEQEKNIPYWEKKISEARETLKTENSSQNKQALANALEGLTGAASNAGMPNMSIGAYKEMLVLYKSLGKPRAVANIHWNIGNEYGYEKESITHYEMAARLYDSLGDIKDGAHAKILIANYYTLKGRHKEAIETNQKALEYARAKGSKPAEALMLQALGSSHFSSIKSYLDAKSAKTIELALKLEEEALIIFKSLHDTLSLANTEHYMAEIISFPNPKEALNRYQAALQWLVQGKLTPGRLQFTAGAFINMASTDQKLAREIWKKAADLHRLKNKDISSNILIELSNSYRWSGDTTTCIALAQDAIELARQQPDQVLLLISMDRLESHLHYFQMYDKAFYLDEEIANVRKNGREDSDGGALNIQIAADSLIYRAVRKNDNKTAFEWCDRLNAYYYTWFDTLYNAERMYQGTSYRSEWIVGGDSRFREIALKNLREASVLFKRVGNLSTISEVDQYLANHLVKAGLYDEADQYVTSAIDFGKRANLNLIDLYSTKIAVRAGQKNFSGEDGVLSCIRESLKIPASTYSKAGLLGTISEYGVQLVGERYDEAEEVFTEAIKYSADAKSPLFMTTIHYCLAVVYRSTGRPAMALKEYKLAFSLYKKLKYPDFQGDVYLQMAEVYLYDLGAIDTANHYIKKARELITEKQHYSMSPPSIVGKLLEAEAAMFKYLGQFKYALEGYDKALKFYRDIPNNSFWKTSYSTAAVASYMAGVYVGIGNTYFGLSNYKKAFEYQQKADSIYKAIDASYHRLAPLANMGEIFFSQGNYPEAIKYFDQSIKISEAKKDFDTNYCILLSNKGLALHKSGILDEAEVYLKRALEISKRIKSNRIHADISGMLASLYIDQNHFQEAEKLLIEQKAFYETKGFPIERGRNAGSFGMLYSSMGNWTKAKPELDFAIQTGLKFEQHEILFDAYFRTAKYYRANKQPQQTREYLMKSIASIDRLKNTLMGGEEAKKIFSSNKSIMEVFEELISLLLEAGETEEAMSWVQKLNDMTLRDKIRAADVDFEDKEKAEALAKERELKMKIEELEKQLAIHRQAKLNNAEQIKSLESIRTVAEADYLKFVNQQVTVQPELSKYFNNTVQPAQLKGKKKQIPKDMALVSYLVGQKQLYIFVATSDTVIARLVPVPKDKIQRDINAMVNITKSHVGHFGAVDLKTSDAERTEIVREARQTDQVMRPFEEAYHYLISPIAEIISSKKRLGIIPTGVLNYIPFQVLGKTLKSGKFSLLINQYALFYTNSTDMLLRVAPEDKDINILAFGNPDKTLPATEKEVNDIRKIFPNTTVYVRDEATEDKAKYAPEEFNVMHFATHGNLDYEDFSKSYLTMAGNAGKNEDGMLTLEELWGMELMSHLNIVVLSACQTAVTKGSDESSPVSPASGFLQNGVKSVVATLWKVDDEATSLLMNDFYKYIKTMDAVDAMRLAQSNLSNNPKFAHPYYWGAMVLIGDWR